MRRHPSISQHTSNTLELTFPSIYLPTTTSTTGSPRQAEKWADYITSSTTNNQYVELSFKHQVIVQYIVNILLWGCESWAIRDYHFKCLNSIIHQSIQQILHIRMSQVIDDHIKNLSIRKKIFNLPTMENLIAIRLMTYLEKLTRGPISNPAKQLLPTYWRCHHDEQKIVGQTPQRTPARTTHGKHYDRLNHGTEHYPNQIKQGWGCPPVVRHCNG